MPDYREVSRLTVRDLIGSDDAPTTVTTDTTLREVATRIRNTPIRAVAVTDAANTDQAVGVVEEGTIVDALAQGRDPNTPCSELLTGQTTDQLVRETTSLEELRRRLGPFRTLLVVDDKGKPIGHVHRDTLADRIRALA
jgi:predicted transcriptional regulator